MHNLQMITPSLILHAAVLWWCASFLSPTTSQIDRLALLSFKAYIVDDPFGALISWNDSLHHCRWPGVSCGGQRNGERVVALNLTSQGLVGSLSPHVGNLSSLTSINLQKNGFYGRIPQEMSRLHRLRLLDLSNNSFTGRIPSNLSHCSNLSSLNLIDNDLTGNIPDELWSLSKLEGLGLSNNKLSVGPLSPSIGNLSSLSRLSLLDCGLRGEIPREISLLQSLRFVQLGYNNLVGEIPQGLYNISAIQYFEVIFNQLQGSISPDLGLKFPQIWHLGLGHNRFTGTIPTTLSNSSALEYVAFSYNNFGGPIPNNLGSLSSLQGMHISDNEFNGDLSFIHSLANCTNLEFLDVSYNFFGGSLPNSFSNLSRSINFIGVDGNQLHGHLPPALKNLVNLVFLGMYMNYLTGSIPASIGELQNLQELYLDMNKFTGELPSSFGNLTSLNRLFLGDNKIYGNIPPSLGSCQKLLELNLSHNSFNGSIPRDLLKLTSISISLTLSDNLLSGPLPEEVGSLFNLAELDLSNNRLSGSIPSSLSKCASLQRLYLENNEFEGGIPYSLISLRGMQELDLSYNNLSGTIPSFLGLLQLEKLNLSFNRLSGEVPAQGVFQNATAISVLGNDGLCGGVSSLKLLACSFSRTKKLKVIIPVVICCFICLVLVISCFIFIKWRRIPRAEETYASFIPSMRSSFLRVSYAELNKATNGFSEDSLIGRGSYGCVYKGTLDHGQAKAVAVKVINHGRRGALKSFMSECKVLTSVKHRNLLKMLSVCSSLDFQGNEFKALVYEYMCNGNLDTWIHQEPESLGLMQRLNIAIDIASAIDYLHNGTGATIVHGDLKPNNVLLDDQMLAHVGDFGLARVISAAAVSRGPQTSSAAVKGTLGYVAPEYGMGGMVSPEGDVYSYGILLLEMFTRRRPTDDMFTDDLRLHNFVRDSLLANNNSNNNDNRVMEIIGPCFLLEEGKSRTVQECMLSVLTIGIHCSMEIPRHRMRMEDVVTELCKIRDIYYT